MLQRHPCVGRTGWEAIIKQDGVVYSDTSVPGGGTMSYWVEHAYYQVSERDTDDLAAACNELTTMLVEAGDRVIAERLFGKLGIPPFAVPAIVQSWEDDDPVFYHPSVYGRMDLRWGNDPALVARDPRLAHPKLLEYNADTPTCFPESTGAQWNWLMLHPTVRGDQWNNAFEALVSAWKRNLELFQRGRGQRVDLVHFVHTAAESSGEDRMNTALVAAAAEQAGYRVKMQYIEDVRLETLDESYATLDETTLAPMGHFLDEDGEPMRVVFKLYPWEWMLHERFGRTALWSMRQLTGTTWVEPPYKLLWSNKGILPVLWEMFRDDPVRSRYLLPAYFEGEEPPGFRDNCVRKPLFGREGANVTVIRGGEVVAANGGEYGAEGHVLQEFAELPVFDGVGGPFHALTGVWMIDNEAAGLCFRESRGPITDNVSFFVPHVITAQG
ncbi:glutathionylspermidine synthase family protein [Plantactinospora sp. GCM10030261]|uniref:glutathionylspermidine synthase family protein n=1 Tax=Plantactinospora sp. GCM10030261 TaxID=3273420 RepID=UPI003609001B